MPVSSPRNSGCRATAWIIEPKMLPMPMPAPSEPRPMPSASAIALPASTLLAASCAIKLNILLLLLDFVVRSRGSRNPSFRGSCRLVRALPVPDPAEDSVLRLDRRADVDGGKGGEDVRLDRDHDHDLEDVEGRRRADGQRRQDQVAGDEDEADERQDQHVAGEHVRVETD